ncbi:MAG: RsmG family class I SAM-dependent methyltransferase, partial [Vampirovibrionales bacterium]|nr:RsmG family class I SAM-dependent methyltransferase [Vampirovibrionales bacterium]
MENANNLIENSQIAKPSDALSSMPPISAEDLSLWNERLSTLGITLLPSVLKPLEAYGNLLIAGNLRMNLTRLTSPHEFWFRHVLDALLLLPYLPKSGRLMDVGSGAGVPLFPLMLATDDKKLEFHAIESTQKKAVFLQEAADALGLQLALHAERAETCGRLPALRESFDVVTARALAAMPVLLE